VKPTAATALSLAGVLGAGALAAAANMRVFAGPDDPTPVGAAIATQPADADATSADGGDTARRDAVGVQTFQIGTAGTVTLDATGGLHVVDTDAAPGWRAEREDAPAGTVVVTFETGGDHDLTATAVLAPDGIRVAVAGEDESADDYRAGGDTSGRDHPDDDEATHDADDD
jgi:hypothetical protein